MSRIVVIGGGIAGLTAGERLSREHDVQVLEREPVAGGKIRSQRLDGYLFEWGPGAFLSSAEELVALVDEIGLRPELTPAAAAAKKRFIYWRGALHALPAKPPDALKMTILSPLGKLRALAEVLVPKRAGADDESVAAFIRRRFGAEVAERLVTPALLGISGGDAAATSVAAIFPRLQTMEAEHGSIVRAMLKSPRKASNLYSFAAGGMQTLTDRLAARLGPRLRTGVDVKAVERTGSGWRVALADGECAADAVIVATPSNVAAELVGGFAPQLAAALREIPYAPMRAVGVAFATRDVPVALDGFGFLAARGQGVRILGAFYTSSIVPAHAPPGTAYLRIFLGGATDRGIIDLDPVAVRSIVLADLKTILGITAEPIAYHEAIWTQAIPQYTLHHRPLVATIEELSRAQPHFALAGNAYRGLGVGDNVRDALAIAARIGVSLRATASTDTSVAT